MKKQTLAGTALAAVIAVAAIGGGTVVASNGGEEGPSARAIITVASGEISLKQAIERAERQAGGRAIDAGVDDDHGTIAYEVTTVADGIVRHLTIDPRTGVVAAQEPGLVERLIDDDDDAEEHAGLAQLPLSLTDAVAAAELATGGTATKAELESEDGAAAYEVDVAVADGIQTVVIDGTSGAVMPDDDSEDDDD